MIATDEGDFVARINQITGGKGARVTFDPIGGKGLEALGTSRGAQEELYEYGALALSERLSPLLTALAKALSVRGYTPREVFADRKLKAKAEKYAFDHVER